MKTIERLPYSDNRRRGGPLHHVREIYQRQVAARRRGDHPIQRDPQIDPDTAASHELASKYPRCSCRWTI